VATWNIPVVSDPEISGAANSDLTGTAQLDESGKPGDFDSSVTVNSVRIVHQVTGSGLADDVWDIGTAAVELRDSTGGALASVTPGADAGNGNESHQVDLTDNSPTSTDGADYQGSLTLEAAGGGSRTWAVYDRSGMPDGGALVLDGGATETFVVVDYTAGSSSGTATPAVIARSFGVETATPSNTDGGTATPDVTARSFGVETATVAGSVVVNPAVIARSFTVPTPTAGDLGSHDYTTYFVPPTAGTSLDSGSAADVDEWPFSASDNAYIQTTASASDNVEWTGFDLSGAPGDKKGFRIWAQMYCDNATGYSIDEIRLVEGGGPTTLWTDSSPGISVTETSPGSIYVIDIPDSAFSGDPDIDDLDIEFDVTNLLASNNRLRFAGIRLSKSPFTSAEETALPSDLSGQDYAVYSADSLATLGAANNEDLVVIPDASGNGRHMLRIAGSTSQYKTADSGYIDFPSTANRFIGAWGSRVTGNHIWHIRLYPEDTTTTQGVFSTAGEIAESVGTPTDPNDKNILGIDDEGSGDKFLLMSGDGTGPAHLYGSTTVTFDAWVRVTEWIQDSGNEHLWLNDDASPDIDGASGSNNLYVWSLGDRETDDRPFQGRISEFWVIDGGSITETNIDDARDEWVNGPGTAGTATPAVISRSFTVETASPVGPAVATPAATARSFTVENVTPVGAGVVAPAAVARTFAVNQATTVGGAAVNPGAVTRVFTVDAVTTSNTDGGTATPAVTARTFGVESASPVGGGVTNPAVVSGTFGVESAGVAGSGAPAVSAIALSFTTPQATPVGQGATTPTQIGLSAVLPAVTLSGGAVVTPGVLNVDLTIPAVSISAGGSATVNPNSIDMLASLLQATPVAPVTVSPSDITATLTVPAATAKGGGVSTAAATDLTFDVNQATPVAPTTVTPNSTDVVFGLPGVSVVGSAGPTPGTIDLTVVIPSVTPANSDAAAVYVYQEGGVSVSVQFGGGTADRVSGSLTSSSDSGSLTAGSQS